METTGESSATQALPNRIRLLLVDEPAVTERVAAALEREDDRFETLAATTAAEGLDRLESTRIDCVVSDYDLPGMDGLSFLETVRDGDERLPFILFPGSGSEELASEAISAGVTDYVRKGDETGQYSILAAKITAAVETRRARAQQDRQLRAIETAQEGISLLDTDGRFVYVNRSYADCFGYEPSALIDERWDVLYDEEEVATIHEEVIPTVLEAGDWRGESNGVRADGSRIVVDHTLSTTGNGELICTVRDITDRKARDRDLERYETIIEALGDPVYTVDAEGRYTYVNDAYAEMTGYEKDEIVGEPVSFLLEADAVERGEDAVRTLLSDDADATQRTYEITVETSDGDRIQCEDHVSLLPLEDGRYRGVAGVVRDISCRKARERELEQYETILETIPDEVYVVDADGHLTKVIPPTDGDLTVTGYRPAELVGEHVSLVMDEADIERGEAKIRELLFGDREKASYELDLVTKDGDRVPNENHVAVLPTEEDEEFRGTVGVLRDISERRERERKLKRQNERLDSFASIVSHDLRNPLNVAQGRLKLARETDGDDLDDHLEAVGQAHERMQVLIDDILAVAREETPVTDGDPIELSRYAETCWRTVETETAALNAPTDAVVRIDRMRFKRLLENLFRNAVEHGSTSLPSQAQEDAVEHGSTGPASQAQQDAGRRSASSEPSVADAPEDAAEHGSTSSQRGSRADDAVEHGDEADGEEPAVTVTVGDLPDGEGFYVEDDGPGIPPDERERVFESGYSTAADGTGFGLAIVERIADAHGWTVDVTEGERGGARFEFRGVDERR